MPGAGKGASVAVRALVAGKKASVVGLGKTTGETINRLQQSVDYFENKEQVSIHEFKHKYLFSKTRPLSLRLVFINNNVYIYILLLIKTGFFYIFFIYKKNKKRGTSFY